MIWRLRERASFRRLRHPDRSGRSGPLVVRYVSADVARPRVGYAIGTRVGNAAVRNGIRRRLRAAAKHIAGTDAALLPPGDYLIVVRAGADTMTYAELEAALRSALRRALGRPTP